MEGERERGRRLLAAIRGLSPGVLEALAGNAPAPTAALIDAIQKALSSPDPEAALAEAMRGVTGVSEPAIRASRVVLEEASELATQVTPIRSALEAVIAGRDQFAAGAREAIAGLPEDPERAAMVERALALLGDDAPFAALRGALDAVHGIERTFAELARGEVEPAALARSAAELRAQRDALVTVRDELARVPGLLSEARALAEQAGDAAGPARLAAAEAALRDREPGSEARWQDVLKLAREAKLLPVAREAAMQIAVAAAARGAFDAVASAAAAVSALAAEQGDVAVELATLGDEALARARMLGGGERARELVARARELARGDGVREVRVRLLEGMVHEHLGDAAAARLAFRKVMDGARQVDGLGDELGWAALHLGQLEAAAGQRVRAAQDLELAQQVGRAAQDARLYLLAMSARLELAADRREAEDLVADLDADPAPLRAAVRRMLDARWPA